MSHSNTFGLKTRGVELTSPHYPQPRADMLNKVQPSGTSPGTPKRPHKPEEAHDSRPDVSSPWKSKHRRVKHVDPLVESEGHT